MDRNLNDNLILGECMPRKLFTGGCKEWQSLFLKKIAAASPQECGQKCLENTLTIGCASFFFVTPGKDDPPCHFYKAGCSADSADSMTYYSIEHCIGR